MEGTAAKQKKNLSPKVAGSNLGLENAVLTAWTAARQCPQSNNKIMNCHQSHHVRNMDTFNMQPTVMKEKKMSAGHQRLSQREPDT